MDAGMEAPDCPEAPGSDENLLHTASHWTMWVRKKNAEPGEFGRADI